MFDRVIIIILDACGVGELPDADDYGDTGASTLPNIAQAIGGLNMPNCQKLGLGNIVPITGVPPEDKPLACFGKMAEKSPGKDSTSGHWEIGGVTLKQPFPVYPDGFPKDLVQTFETKTGVKTIGNIPASGTEIIKDLGERHLETGEIILYTSADSVFQLAAHEDIIPVERLYEICTIAREILTGEHAVGRVIARPFVGKPGDFTRTTNRRDFSLEPPGDTFIDLMQKKRLSTVSIGKIFDLYARRGFSKVVKAKTNDEIMYRLADEMSVASSGLLFSNLVDFDMLWGHRNDTESFAAGLERFDRLLPTITNKMTDKDLLIITADHGCDPTLKYSTDHTREYVPLLIYNKNVKSGQNLGTRTTFGDIAETINEIFILNHTFGASSCLKEIVRAVG
jgi:phosphopentomutase